MLRYRERDFVPIEHEGGTTPGWPIAYAELEPWYGRAERLFQVRGAVGQDPTEPRHSEPYPHAPVPDEPAIAAVRERLAAQGLHPFSLPLAIDIERWLQRAATPWDAFPDTRSGKLDAETAALAAALRSPDVTLVTGAKVERLLPARDGRRIEGVEYFIRMASGGRCRAATVVLVRGRRELGGPPAAALGAGVANRSGTVGRYFMNHNCTAMLAVDPRVPNDSVYQKTLGINDFYFDDGKGGPPLGNVQLLGKISGADPPGPTRAGRPSSPCPGSPATVSTGT